MVLRCKKGVKFEKWLPERDGFEVREKDVTGGHEIVNEFWTSNLNRLHLVFSVDSDSHRIVERKINPQREPKFR